MKIKLFLLPVLSCLLIGTAYANWQYGGDYAGVGWYEDDGSRFTLSFRGGAVWAYGKVKNDIGSLTAEYWQDPVNGAIYSQAYYDACVADGDCANFVNVGSGNLGSLQAKENYSAVAFVAGGSLGWTLPHHPQWRLELGWDHMAETEYNESPMFEGDIALSGGTVPSVHVASSRVSSEMSADVISVMAFYDFYSGLQKPIHKVIPYIGIGAGYSDSETTLNLSDLYGDLSSDADLQNFGELDNFGVLQFYTSKTRNANIAALLTAGISYGLTSRVFFDFGARFIYIPKIKWQLSNENETRHRDWFSTKNMMFTGLMLGLRFEF